MAHHLKECTLLYIFCYFHEDWSYITTIKEFVKLRENYFFDKFLMLYFTSNGLKSPKDWNNCNIFQICVKIKMFFIIVFNFHKDITKIRFMANYWKLFVKITVLWLAIILVVYVMHDLVNATLGRETVTHWAL